MKVFKWMIWILHGVEMAGQTQPAVSIQVHPQVVGRPIRDGQVTTVFLAPRYVTAIRMPEPINSVVVGDPASFSAEHSDREPQLVFVKPITAKAGADQPADILDTRPAGEPASGQSWRAEGRAASRRWIS